MSATIAKNFMLFSHFHNLGESMANSDLANRRIIFRCIGIFNNLPLFW